MHTLPCPHREMGLKEVHQMVIQFRKRVGAELGSRLGERRFGGTPTGSGRLVDELEKGIQFGLNGTLQKIDHEEDEGGKREATVSYKIGGGDFMPLDKGVGANELFEGFAQVGTIFTPDLWRWDSKDEKSLSWIESFRA